MVCLLLRRLVTEVLAGTLSCLSNLRRQPLVGLAGPALITLGAPIPTASRLPTRMGDVALQQRPKVLSVASIEVDLIDHPVQRKHRRLLSGRAVDVINELNHGPFSHNTTHTTSPKIRSKSAEFSKRSLLRSIEHRHRTMPAISPINEVPQHIQNGVRRIADGGSARHRWPS